MGSFSHRLPVGAVRHGLGFSAAGEGRPDVSSTSGALIGQSSPLHFT